MVSVCPPHTDGVYPDMEPARPPSGPRPMPTVTLTPPRDPRDELMTLTPPRDPRDELS